MLLFTLAAAICVTGVYNHRFEMKKLVSKKFDVALWWWRFTPQCHLILENFIVCLSRKNLIVHTNCTFVFVSVMLGYF